MNLVHETAASYNLQLARPHNDINYLRALRPLANAKFRVVIDAALQLLDACSRRHTPQTVINGTSAAALHNTILRYRCIIS